jgi:hypothetical protein
MTRDEWDKLIIATIVLVVIGLTVWFLPIFGEIDNDSANKALTGAGYSKIELGSYKWFTCGDDTFSRGFKAVGPTGVPVNGVLCQGWIKGITIRLEQ